MLHHLMIIHLAGSQSRMGTRYSTTYSEYETPNNCVTLLSALEADLTMPNGEDVCFLHHASLIDKGGVHDKASKYRSAARASLM